VGRYGARAVLSRRRDRARASGYGLMAGMHAWWQFALAWAWSGSASRARRHRRGLRGARMVQRSRGLALGIVYTGSNLGGAIATRSVAALAAADGWRWRRRGDARRADRRAAPGGVACSCAIARPRPSDGPTTSPRRRVRPRRARGAAHAQLLDHRGGLTGFWAYLYAMLQHFVLALVDAACRARLATAHWSNAVFMGMFSKIAFGWIADRVPRRTALLLDYGCSRSRRCSARRVHGRHATLWGFVLTFGFSYAARDVVHAADHRALLREPDLAQIYGVLMLTILVGPLGGTFAGWVHDQTGSYQIAFEALARRTRRRSRCYSQCATSDCRCAG
jgi:nitrate/nitrite transporter NarK